MKMKKLHEEFVNALYTRIPKRADLVTRIAETLKIEKESASRRLSGKVNFTIQEMGILATGLHISIDALMYKNTNIQWLPFSFTSPINSLTVDTLCDTIEYNLKQIKEIAQRPIEYGSVYNTLPLEFFKYYPLLGKLMLFKWGYYFVGSKEFNKFSQWEIPQRLSALIDGSSGLYNFARAFYIWDNSLVWTLVEEIENFHNMHIITTGEKEELKNEIKLMLSDLEAFLKGKSPFGVLQQGVQFYVSIINMGFTSYYFASDIQCLSVFQTLFNHSILSSHHDKVNHMKEWIKDLRNFSTLLSGSGSIERRLFFEKQHNIIDHIL